MENEKKKLELNEVRLKSALEYATYLQSEMHFQKEVRDRWFRYYLIITTLPLGVVIGLFRFKEVNISLNGFLPVVTLSSFILFVLGFLFFLVHIHQRINYLSGVKRISGLETKDIVGFFNSKDTHHKILNSPMERNQLCADLYTNRIYIFLNSVWIATAGFFFATYISEIDALVKYSAVVGIFIVSLFFHVTIRNRLLAVVEEDI